MSVSHAFTGNQLIKGPGTMGVAIPTGPPSPKCAFKLKLDKCNSDSPDEPKEKLVQITSNEGLG